MAAPKSILKKHPAATSRSKEERDLEIALYHANLLQERKDTELQILLNTEALIDYPLISKPYDALNPSPSDAQSFKELIQAFQPSDYDALITERNINEHCGYALCPNNRVKDGRGGKYRLLGTTGKAKDFRVVAKGELEKWCSSACAKRALYVRVQLTEAPAWERNFASGQKIDLLDEPKSEEDMIVEGVDKMDLGTVEEPKKEQNTADLAFERGDRGFAAKQGLVDVDIMEKAISKPVQAPSFETEDLSGRLGSLHLEMEGHMIEFGGDTRRQHHDDLEDDTNATIPDWEL